MTNSVASDLKVKSRNKSMAFIRFEPKNSLMGKDDKVSNFILKTQIQGILESYNGKYDILNELVQNAVDAIEDAFSGQKNLTELPEIEVYINLQSNTVRVSDNGVGINRDDAKSLIAPHFTLKNKAIKQRKLNYRGYKGVGLTFIACISNSIKFCTKYDGVDVFSAEVNGLNSWVNSEESTSPPNLLQSTFESDFIKSHNRGSSFEIQVDSTKIPKGITLEGWEWVLRTQTAIGYFNLNEKEEWQKKIKVVLNVIDESGQILTPKNKTNIDFEFLYPHKAFPESADINEMLNKSENKVSIDKKYRRKYFTLFGFWDNSSIKKQLADSDNELTAVLIDKYKVSAYGCFLHSSTLWGELNKKYSSKHRSFWKAGIQIVVNSMPTGKIIDVGLITTMSRKERIFTLVSFEGTGIKSDLGRKEFQDDIGEVSREITRKIIGIFSGNTELLKPPHLAHGENPTEQEYTMDEKIEKFVNAPELGFEKLSFKKIPQNEQDTIALFHELIGKDILLGYQVLGLSYSQDQYDAVIKYSLSDNKDSVYDEKKVPLGISATHFKKKSILTKPKNLEFKKYLSELINDFDAGTKLFAQIKYVVCWDIGDTNTFKESDYSLEELNENHTEDKRMYYGVTHHLYTTSDGALPISVICLKTVLQILKSKNLLA